MKKQTIIRAAVLAALSITAIILGVIAFTPQKQENIFVEVHPVATPEVVHIELAGTTGIPLAPTIPPTLHQLRKQRLPQQYRQRLIYKRKATGCLRSK